MAQLDDSPKMGEEEMAVVTQGGPSQSSEEVAPLYNDFLPENARHFKHFEIVKLESFSKYYRIMKTNPMTNRFHQLVVCKYQDCQKHFYKISNLFDHLNVHDSVKQYTCPKCQNPFV